MKRFLLSLPILFLTSPAYAEGRSHDGGCSTEQSDAFCSMISFGLMVGITFVVVFGIWDAYRMRTDPAYRARAEQLRREGEEARRRGGY